MPIEKIYARAVQSPDKIAVIYNNKPISYRLFAHTIEVTRQYLARQDLRGAGVAVLEVKSRLAFWVLGLALRSLGKTTVEVPSLNAVDQLGLRDIRYVVATEAEHRPDAESLCTTAGWRLIKVPSAIYADYATGALPRLDDVSDRTGGHILLTSGTTGAHKKILIGSDNLTTLAAFREKNNGISEDSVVNLFCFPGWTSTGYVRPTTIWGGGATAVIYDGPNPWEAFRYRGITDTVVIPQMLAKILSAPDGTLSRDDAMRLVVTGGSLPKALAEETKRRLTQRIFLSLASTEGLGIALTPVEGPDDLYWHRILPEREVQIVDEQDRELPAGQVGILRVRLLPGISGYLDDPEATRIFFRHGYFYPGDVGVIRSDGRLALHGRVTDVINVLGKKLAAGPIEQAVQDKFGVGGVCVFAASDPSLANILHVVIESRQPIAATALGTVLRECITGAGTLFFRTHFIEALPRNDMGKIQRNLVKHWLGIS